MMPDVEFTSNYVIPRRLEESTWESPGTVFVTAQQNDDWYQEIATVALLPRNDRYGGYSLMGHNRPISSSTNLQCSRSWSASRWNTGPYSGSIDQRSYSWRVLINAA